MAAKELVVLHQFQLSGSVLLVFVACVAAHAGYTALFLLGTFKRHDLTCTFCLLGHCYLDRANRCAGLWLKRWACMKGYVACQGSVGTDVHAIRYAVRQQKGFPAMYRWMMLVIVMLCVGCAPKQPVRGDVVERISFEGNAGLFGGVPDSTLRGAMVQSASPRMWWMNPSERAVVLDPSVLVKDAWRIETWYANHGYFNVRVKGWDVVTEKEAKPRRNKPRVVSVVGQIVELKPSKIKSIEWEGFDGIGPALLSLVQKKASIAVGETFNAEAVHETEGLVLNRLHDMSFGFATVTAHVDAHPEQRLVNIRIVANTGPSCRFGAIEIIGDHNVPEAYIRSEVTIREGAAFRASTLAETQRRLFGLGVFSMVNVVPDLSNSNERVIPIRLELSSTKERQLRLGAGVLIESGKQDVHALAEFQHVNLLGKLWDLTTRARPGYAWIASLDDFGDESIVIERSPTAEVSSALTVPHFLLENMSLTNTVDGEYGLEEGYKFVSPSYSPSLSYAVSSKFSVRLGYEIRYFRYVDLSADDSLGRNRFGLNFTNPYVLSALEQEFTWNTRDNALFPSKGEYIVASIKEAGGPFGGGFNYIQARADVRVFRRVRRLLGFRPNVTVAMRAGAGGMLPFESGDGLAEVPFAERMVLGGANDVRGWSRGHLGPYLCDSEDYSGVYDLDDPVQAARCAGQIGRNQHTDAIQPIGGTALMHGTFEIRKYTLDGYGVALFNDWGMVWNGLEEVDPLTLLPSAGIGLRYKSPIGAIRLDSAYRFNIEPMFKKEPTLQIHFGLSEAF